MTNGDAENTKSTKPVTPFLQTSVVYTVKFLAVVMVLLIIASLIDVLYVFYDRVATSQPFGVILYKGIFDVLGAVLMVLICIEIFNNIILYLRDERTHVKLVIATALIAVSRKVIILDYSATDASYIYATGAVVIATAIAYWLVASKASY